MNTEIKNAVAAADDKAQYDEYAKRLLAQKDVLAHILDKTVNEFKDMNPKDVVQYIEGEPYISVVPVKPRLTNSVGMVSAESGDTSSSKTDEKIVWNMYQEGYALDQISKVVEISIDEVEKIIKKKEKYALV